MNEQEAKRTDIEATLDMIDAKTAADLCGIARGFSVRGIYKTFVMNRLLSIRANSPEIIERLQERYRQTEADRDALRALLATAREKAHP